jgi:hypothetical protein
MQVSSSQNPTPVRQHLATEVLVVGGGAGGTAAALQAARRGAKTILVSEFPWLGGMLTSAGVTAPDGNELACLQTGIWGDFLRQLSQRQPGGLDHAWVSFFTYEAAIGAAIFADWVAALPNLRWIAGQTPQQVLRQGNQVTGVIFEHDRIDAAVTIDATELGDLLALGDIPHRWGWEWQAEFGEPSAPIAANELTQRYPVQVPTWVVVLQDFGADQTAPAIPAPPNYNPQHYEKAWANYADGGLAGAAICLNYGRLPADRFMLNWPTHGNDYGEGVARLLGDAAHRQAYCQEALWHSQGFAHYIQSRLGRRYGLATGSFPTPASVDGLTPAERSAFALHPYYRESRRLIGQTTVREQDLLPLPSGRVAALPFTTSASGCEDVSQCCEAIAVGNYVLDHHYPSGDIALSKKSMRWGGRWTGTPFTIPYRSLVPATIEGFLVGEKNIAVTHMANGATRLQPLVLGIGQAAGMAAALCVEQRCQPRQLAVRSLQNALITDPIAPNAVLPLLNLVPQDPQWRYWQTYYLDHPDSYPHSGEAPLSVDWAEAADRAVSEYSDAEEIFGTFMRIDHQSYELHVGSEIWSLVTLDPIVDRQLLKYPNAQPIGLNGRRNVSGNWILIAKIRSNPAEKALDS